MCLIVFFQMPVITTKEITQLDETTFGIQIGQNKYYEQQNIGDQLMNMGDFRN